MDILYIVNSCPLLAHGISSVITDLQLNCQVKYINSPEESVSEAKIVQPSIYILSLFTAEGLNFVKRIKDISTNIKLILLIPKALERLIPYALEHRPHCIIFTESSIHTFTNALLSVAKGKFFFDKDVQNAIVKSFNNEIKINLTRRETEVLKLVFQGFTSKSIANKLNVSVNTIETFRKSLFSKFCVKNSTTLINRAMELGFI